MKETIKKNLKTVLCVVAIIALLFPICKLEASYVEESISGFLALGITFFAYLLILGPVLLAVMDHIDKLDGKQGLLSIAVPIVCFISLIITIFASRNQFDFGILDDIEVHIGFGSILLILDYIALLIVGIAQYHNKKFNKVKDIVESAKEVISDNIQNKKGQ